jgi:cobalamin biosynthesis protein CobD/CbiB
MRKTIGWIIYVAGCLATFIDLINLNLLQYWLPGLIIAPILMIVGVILLKLRWGAFWGVLFGMLALSNMAYIISSKTIVGALGVVLFGLISWSLLKGGLFKTKAKPITPSVKTEQEKLRDVVNNNQ